MKTAAQYVLEACPDWPEAPVAVMPVAAAERAVAAALADAEKYKCLLVKAIRNVSTYETTPAN